MMSFEECPVPSEDDMTEAWASMMQETRVFDTTLTALPLLAPLAAILSYENVARFTRHALDILGERNTWVAVDGNAYQIAILAPVVNGIVVPSVSIAFGTMMATTVNTLRQRQTDMRNLLNSELCAVDTLRAALSTLSDDDFHLEEEEDDDALWSPTTRLTSLLRDYVSRLIAEAKPGFSPYDARVADNELSRLATVLYGVESQRRRTATAAEAARAAVSTLADLRSERLAKLAATYPSLHYTILFLCGVSIIAAFCIESDQEILRFLDSIQLRLLFAILVGAFSGLSTLVADLADLHRGTLRITPIAVQFFLLRDSLTFDLCTKEAERFPPGSGSGTDDDLDVGLYPRRRRDYSSSQQQDNLVLFDDLPFLASSPFDNRTAAVASSSSASSGIS